MPPDSRILAPDAGPAPPVSEPIPTKLPPSWIDVLLTVVFTIIAGYIACSTLAAAWHSLSPLPLYDQWAFTDPAASWQTLFAVHNEHRIVLSKLTFIADQRLLGGRNIADYLVTAFMLLVMGGLYFVAVGLDRSTNWSCRMFAAAVAVCFTVSPLTIGVLLWGMHVQNVGVNLFAGIAFFLLIFAAAKPSGTARRTFWLSLAVASGAVATFTSASGLLAAFLLIIEAAVLRFGWREIACIAVCAVVAAFLYLHGNTAQGNASGAVHASPIGVARFFLLFLGSLIPQAVDLSDVPRFGRLVSIIGLASIVLLGLNALIYFIRARRRMAGGNSNGFALFCLTFAAFLLGSAALVSAGRLPFGFDHAFTEHYNILRTVYWVNLILSIPACWTGSAAWRLTAVVAIAASIIVCMEIRLRDEGLKWRAASLNHAGGAIGAQVYDMGAWASVNNWNLTSPATYPFMKQQDEFLRQNRYSIFHDAPAAWSGRDIHTLPTTQRPVRGSITKSEAHADPSGAYQSVSGWIDVPYQIDRDPEIVLVDASGKIIGFGAMTPQPGPHTDWHGYTRSATAPADAYFYAEGKLTRLANTQ
jgi:hypothetical protein